MTIQRRQIFRGVATRRDAMLGDRATLRALEEESAAQEGRPSRYRDARDGQPAGVYPSGAFGKARNNYRPQDHVATGYDGVHKGRDGKFYYRLPDEHLDDRGEVLERPDLPSVVDIDGATQTVETVGVRDLDRGEE